MRLSIFAPTLSRTALFLGALLLLGGCRPPSDAERAFSHFREHLEKQQTAQAWAMLTRKSQRSIQQALERAQSKEDPKNFFQKATFLRGLRLRPHPIHPLRQTQDSATIHFLDELGRPQSVTLRREDNTWRIDLRGVWSNDPPTSRPSPNTSRPSSAVPSTSQSTNPPRSRR